MKYIYSLYVTQGQGGGDTELMPLFEVKALYLRTLGDGAIGVLKDGKLLTHTETCQEFEIDEAIVDKIIKLKMEINGLWGQL